MCSLTFLISSFFFQLWQFMIIQRTKKMSCPFKKELSYMLLRRMMMAGMRVSWMAWRVFSQAITWSQSCTILNDDRTLQQSLLSPEPLGLSRFTWAPGGPHLYTEGDHCHLNHLSFVHFSFLLKEMVIQVVWTKVIFLLLKCSFGLLEFVGWTRDVLNLQKGLWHYIYEPYFTLTPVCLMVTSIWLA